MALSRHLHPSVPPLPAFVCFPSPSLQLIIEGRILKKKGKKLFAVAPPSVCTELSKKRKVRAN